MLVHVPRWELYLGQTIWGLGVCVCMGVCRCCVACVWVPGTHDSCKTPVANRKVVVYQENLKFPVAPTEGRQ